MSVFHYFIILPKQCRIKENFRHQRLRRASALFAALSALLLSGCAPSAAADSALPALTVGSDTYPPYVYMDNNGDITGLDVEIAQEAFRRMGYRAEFTTIDWEKKTELVDSGEIDCIWDCFSMEGRENDYQWAGPYLVSRQVVAVDAQSGIETMSDLAGKPIAVQATGTPEGICTMDSSESRRSASAAAQTSRPSGTSSASRTAACSTPCSTAAIRTRSRRTRRPSGSI